MTDKLDDAVRLASSILNNKPHVTVDDIDNAIKQYVAPLISCGSLPGVDSTVVRQELINIFCASTDKARILEGRERREPWLAEFKQKERSSWTFWKDYRKYLLEQKMMQRSVVDELDRLTDQVLDKLFDPTREDITLHKKGMVVGQVQSGKTGNYTGLICKAADAGFNIIIVLAGLHNNLRSQTQLRLDEGFLGFDTQYERAIMLDSDSNIGVGKLRLDHKHPAAHSYTTSRETGDFKKSTAEGLGLSFNTREPVIMVVKKNTSVLGNLDNWLMAKIAPEDRCSDKSVLIIDDECDNASINTNKDGGPTAINKWIRSIMGRFNRVAYVGYTATPFANIFIPADDADIFPRDFIINLPVPQAYIGPERVFGLDNGENSSKVDLLPIVSTIDDYESFVPTKHRKSDPLPDFSDFPESLKLAIRSFILTCAVRMARGQENKHNSMLIHLSRYQIWQEEIKYQVTKVFNFYKDELEYGEPLVYEQFRRMFEESEDGYTCYKDVTDSVLATDYSSFDAQIRRHTWDEIKPYLKKAASRIMVRSINGSSADVLSYYENRNGLYVIVIGGDKLSRGLTLEGLSVSYFLRASKMYDTLMQMGRWFGYRPGYADLCRLFISSELNEWFRHITAASDELRSEFDYLCDVGGTPDAFGLKVRSHPGVLQITASNKMRHVRHLQVSWSARLMETYALPRDNSMKHANFAAMRQLVEELPERYMLSGAHYLWKGIPADAVTRFIGKFHVASSLKAADLDLVTKYIEKLNAENELCKWNIVLINKTKDVTASAEYPHGIKVGCQKRTSATGVSDNIYCVRNNHIIGAADEFLDLTEEEFREAMQLTIETKAAAGEEWTQDYPNGAITRELYRDANCPLLMLYTLDPYFANPVSDDGEIIEAKAVYKHNDEPFAGFAIAFPRTGTDCTVAYTANMIQEFENSEDMFDADNDNDYSNNQ